MKSLKIGQIFNYSNTLPYEEKVTRSKIKPKELIKTVIEYLTKYGFYGSITTQWSSLSGCSACPCSPGWDVFWTVPDLDHVQDYAEQFKSQYKHPTNRFWFFDEGDKVRIILPHHAAKDAKHITLSYHNAYVPANLPIKYNQPQLPPSKSTEMVITKAPLSYFEKYKK